MTAETFLETWQTTWDDGLDAVLSWLDTLPRKDQQYLYRLRDNMGQPLLRLLAEAITVEGALARIEMNISWWA